MKSLHKRKWTNKQKDKGKKTNGEFKDGEYIDYEEVKD